jgi:hypothetical protein
MSHHKSQESQKLLKVSGKTIHNPGPDENRRLLLLSLGASFATLAFQVPSGIDAVVDLIDRVSVKKRVATVPESVEPLSDEEKASRIRRLFFPRTGNLDLLPAMDHPIYAHPPDRTYPNEEFAQNSVMKLFPGPAQEVTDHPTL